MNSFDLLRLGAALLVILHHCRPLNGGRAIAFGNLDFGALGVGVFFVISGYLVTASWRRAPAVRVFLAKRLLRIEPGLIVSLAVTALVIGAAASRLPLGAYLAQPQTWLYVARNALLYPVTYALPGVFERNSIPAVVNGSLWTLRLEFTCYLGVAALGAVGLLNGRVIAAGAAVLLAVAVVLGVLRPELAADGPLRLVLIAAQFGFLFLAGAALRLVERPVPAWALASVVFLATPAWMLGLPAAVIWLGERRGPRLRADLSYGLYIYAFPLQQMLAAQGALNFWTAVAATAPVAALSWFLIEKPALRLKPGGRVEPEAHLASRGR